jgi:hypothetical protein
MTAHCRLYLFALLALLLPALPAGAAPAEQERGILLLAHGSHGSHGGAHGQHGAPSVWNRNVERLAQRLDARLPTELAFGMADPETMQAAVERLEARGVRDIAVVPLFVSSHSPIIGNSRYILGLQPELAKTTSLRHLDRVRSTAHFRFAGAMDAHPLVSAILLERALAITDDAPAGSVTLIAHGPNDEEENLLWLRDMETHAEYLRRHGGFRSVAFLTHRNDAPAEVKARAREEFRERVAAANREGTALVVPLLLSAGGIEAQVKADLDGLPHRFAEPLMPHTNLERWVETTAEALFAAPATAPDQPSSPQ